MGNPVKRTKDSLVAYLDILGTKDFVRKCVDRPEILARFDGILQKALENIGGLQALRRRQRRSDWKIRIFSDSIYIVRVVNDLALLELVEGVAAFQRELAGHGFLLRGGIALNRHAEHGLSTASPALIEAHELESRRAIYPRVMVSTALAHRIDQIVDPEIRKDVKEYLTLDRQGDTFICYFVFFEGDDWYLGETFFARHKALIEAGLRLKGANDVVAKYEWLARYHNWCVQAAAQIAKTHALMDADTVIQFQGLLVKGFPPHRQFRSLLWKDPEFRPRFTASEYSSREIVREAKRVKNWATEFGPTISWNPDDEDGDPEFKPLPKKSAWLKRQRALIDMLCHRHWLFSRFPALRVRKQLK